MSGGLTGDQIVFVAILVVLFAAICFLAEARIQFADEKILRLRAETRAETYLARAEAAEKIINETATPRPLPFPRRVT